jgi:hypothetical protein
MILDRKQILLQSLLRTYFLDAPISSEAQQGTEYLIELLIQQKLWRASELYAPALLSLRGYWTDEKIAQTAKTIITNRYPTMTKRDEFFQPAAWIAIKSGYVKDDAQAALYTQTNAENKFADIAMETSTHRLRQEYEQYIREYPNKPLPKIPNRDSKGTEIVFVEEAQGVAILALLSGIQ